MDLLNFALTMEYDLQDFYRRQANLNQGNKLYYVFNLLEKEEENHAKILRSHAEKIVLPLTDSSIISEVRLIFKDLKDFNSEIKNEPSQLDIYRKALEMEEQSLEFYKDFLDKVNEEESKTVIQYLIKQEDTHCIILEELIKLVTRPEEWVESAEFGLREDY